VSKCTQWVDQGVIGCKTWADEQTASCSQWADEGSNQCGTWADEGSNQCSTWADEGSSHCCTWWPCSWLCDAYYWVAKWVCKAWYWVAKWVCKAWYWVAKWMCKIWFWIVKAVCTIWEWIAKLVCVAWGNIRCVFNTVLSPFRRARARPRITKVFVLMLENRSFDHMLGFASLTGTDAITGIPATADNLVGKNLTAAPFANSFNGTFSPSPTNPAPFKIPDEDKDPGHEFMNVLLQLTGTTSWNDQSTAHVYPPITSMGYVESYSGVGSAHPGNIMLSYPPDRITVLTKLAQEFAVCDNWFSSMPGPTWPNRFFLHAASSGGLDDSPSGAESAIASLVDGYRFTNGTIFDRLDGNCIDWQISEGDEFPQVFAISGMELNALEGRYSDFEDFASEVTDPNFSPKYIFIEPSYGNILPTTPGDFTCGTSQHPLDDITRGEWLIKRVYEAIRSSPHWETSALVITYDEHGGFFDHVPPPGMSAAPPVVPPGDPIASDANNHHNFQFDQLGVRVPAVIISPLIPKATIDHTRYDHSSVSRTLCRLFGMKTLTMRDAAANDFLHLFSLATARTDTPLTLPEPANSNWTCEPGVLTDLTDASDVPEPAGSDDSASSSSSLTGAPATEQQRTKQQSPTRDNPTRQPESLPVPSSFWGFMRVALRRALLTVPPGPTRRRKQIIQQYLDVRTEQDARRFIHESRLRVRRFKNPIDEWRPLQMQRTEGRDAGPGKAPPRGDGPGGHASSE